jgi:hypothetical protein
MNEWSQLRYCFRPKDEEENLFKKDMSSPYNERLINQFTNQAYTFPAPFLLTILTFFCVRSLTMGRIIFQSTANQDGALVIIITS